VCFDWGGTLMSEVGPADIPMALWPTVEVLPGARECLSLLAGHLPLAIASNASVSDGEMIRRALARVGLARFFTAVFCRADLGAGKREPAFWTEAVRGLGVAPESIAMVGDSLEDDVLAPRRCGVQTVWLNAGPAPAGVLAVDTLPRFAAWVLAARP